MLWVASPQAREHLQRERAHPTCSREGATMGRPRSTPRAKPELQPAPCSPKSRPCGPRRREGRRDQKQQPERGRAGGARGQRLVPSPWQEQPSGASPGALRELRELGGRSPVPAGGTTGAPAAALGRAPPASSARSGAWAGQGPGFTSLGVPGPSPRGAGDAPHYGGGSGRGKDADSDLPGARLLVSAGLPRRNLPDRRGLAGSILSCAPPSGKPSPPPAQPAASALGELHLPQGTGAPLPRPVGQRGPCACVLAFLPSPSSPETTAFLPAKSRN